MEKILAMGAEAIILKTVFHGIDAVRKIRVRKKYRDPALDSRLRRERTILEARLLAKSAEAGVPSPRPLAVVPSRAELVMDYIWGRRLRDVIGKTSTNIMTRLFRRLGKYVGILHEAGIIHGDLTTSNFIWDGSEVFIVDFGLGFFSRELERQGVDIHLMLRALESTHHKESNVLFKAFKEGYLSIRGEIGNEVLAKVWEIRRRGRYVAERRVRKRF